MAVQVTISISQMIIKVPMKRFVVRDDTAERLTHVIKRQKVVLGQYFILLKLRMINIFTDIAQNGACFGVVVKDIPDDLKLYLKVDKVEKKEMSMSRPRFLNNRNGRILL